MRSFRAWEGDYLGLTRRQKSWEHLKGTWQGRCSLSNGERFYRQSSLEDQMIYYYFQSNATLSILHVKLLSLPINIIITHPIYFIFILLILIINLCLIKLWSLANISQLFNTQSIKKLYIIHQLWCKNKTTVWERSVEW